MGRPGGGDEQVPRLRRAVARGATQLRPRTRELYEANLRLHILPILGEVELGELTPSRVCSWHAGLVAAGKPGPPTVAKCYRILHSILATAVEDELILKNPCIIKGAAVDRSDERPVATVEEVLGSSPHSPACVSGSCAPSHALASTFPTGPFKSPSSTRTSPTGPSCSVLRRSARADAPLCFPRSPVRVGGTPRQVGGAGEDRARLLRDEGPAVQPQDLLPRLARGDERGGPRGLPLSRLCRRRHNHDLSHTGNTLAAATGASTKELMRRMGHASPRAALIYQHATHDRDAAMARALSDIVSAVGRKAEVAAHGEGVGQ